jgi:hypothetical protein
MILLFPLLLPAQHRAPVVAAQPSLAAKPPVLAPPPANSSVHRSASNASPSRPLPANHRVVISHSKPVHSRPQISNALDDPFSDSSVPGLGFDAVHFAATHPDSGHKHHRSNFPLYGGGYFYSYPPENPAPSQASADDEEDFASPYDDRRPPRPQYLSQPAPAATLAPIETFESPHGPDEYIFIRRDGTVFFAVAYSWDHNTLRYVTPQGLRQSLSGDALDLDATHRFNEQRGLAFRAPV